MKTQYYKYYSKEIRENIIWRERFDGRRPPEVHYYSHEDSWWYRSYSGLPTGLSLIPISKEEAFMEIL